MTMEVKIKPELRLCYILDADDEKIRGLFHRWVNSNNTTFALVEMSNGTMVQCLPAMVQFIDDAFANYAWPGKSDA